MQDWKTYKLGELTTDISYGYTESASKVEIGPKFLRITDIQADFISWEGVPFCKISEKNKLRYQLEIGDIVIARTGNSTGATAVIKTEINAVYASYLIRYRLNKKLANPFYIDFVLRSKRWENFVASIKGGSAQPGANAKQFAEFEINLPPFSEQNAIATILSALDGKIELNLQMNKTLEEMAMALYKHWFVDFGPFQNGKFVESDLGMIPEGWEVKRLDEVTQELRRGISPNYTEGEGVEVVNQRCIRNHEVDFSLTRKHDINKKKVEGRLIEIGDVLVNSTGVGTLGRMAPVIQLKGDTVVDSHVTVVRVNTKKFFINNFARLMLHIEPIVEGMGEGSTGQTELSRVALGEIKVLVPPLNEQKHVEVHFQLFSETVANNLNSNQTLTTLRDTLLPKLISGEVRVKDIEPMVAASL